MLGTTLDPSTLMIVVAGALLAGFTTGFAGFGTGLVASGLWFHALPAPMVPPLVVLASVAGQTMSLLSVRRAFDWPRAAPYLVGGALGVPLGLAALAAASPIILRTSIGAFLVAYAAYQLLAARVAVLGRGGWAGGPVADGMIGIGGGFLGGFAGLSGALPLIWLQLQGGDPGGQRAVYQPFNLIVLTLATAGMAFSGQLSSGVLWIALACLPATLLGAWAGARIYGAVSPQTFQRVVLGLLLVSGAILLAQAIA